jgi:hypothetical protein
MSLYADIVAYIMWETNVLTAADIVRMTRVCRTWRSTFTEYDQATISASQSNVITKDERALALQIHEGNYAVVKFWEDIEFFTQPQLDVQHLTMALSAYHQIDPTLCILLYSAKTVLDLYEIAKASKLSDFASSIINIISN